MTFPSGGDVDIIATQILVDARSALRSLQEFNENVDDSRQRLRVLRDVVRSTAEKLGGDFSKAEKAVQRFSGAISGIGSNEIKIATNLARQMNVEVEKIIDARERENALIEEAGAKLSRQLLAQQRLADAAAAKRATQPENLIPSFVQKQFGDINAHIARSGNAVQAWKDVVKRSAAEAGVSFEKAGAELKKLVSGTSVKDLNTALKELGGNAEGGFGRALTAVNALRIALGALVAMIIFQVIQAFSNMVRGALKGLTEIEAAMFNVANAERELSEQGVEISVEGLQELIDKLKELNPMLSDFQATELISVLTTKVAPALHLGQKEIESLAESITLLSVRNQALGKSFEEVEQQVVTGLLSGRVTSGINQLGVKITDLGVQEEALRLKLVSTEKAYRELNSAEKERIDALAIISILEKNTAKESENLPAFLKTASGLIAIAKAEFQDLLTTLGQKFAPVLKTVFEGIIQVLERINKSLVEDEDAWETFITFVNVGAKATMMLVEAFVSLGIAIGETGRRMAEFLRTLPILGSIVNATFPESEFSDTPTSPGGAFGGSSSAGEAAAKKRKDVLEKAEEDMADIMQDARDKRLDIERDYQRKLQDIARDYSQKLVDIARDTEQKREDALRDLNQKLEDIERDTNEAVKEANEDYRQKEIDREREYQNRLRELREKFLMDLEDALHERDARQILRLIRQYNLEKKNLQERKKLEDAQAKTDLQKKLKDLEYERQLKIENARREYAEKLEEIRIGEQRALEEAATWRRRQLEDARIWHQRQLQEQREYLQRRLQDLAQAIAKELQLTSAGAAGVQSILAGLGGSMSGAFNGISASLSNSFSDFVALMNANSNPIAAPGFIPYSGNPANSNVVPHFAEGGTLIARRPTMAVFGEKGDEAVTFTPLNRQGRNVGQVFGDRAGAGAGGSLGLRIAISDGLIAEIVDASLDNVAAHVEHIRRER